MNSKDDVSGHLVIVLLVAEVIAFFLFSPITLDQNCCSSAAECGS